MGQQSMQRLREGEQRFVDGNVHACRRHLRHGIGPRKIPLTGFAVGLVLLLVITDFAWIALLIPSWVLLVSAYSLVADFFQGRQVTASA